MAAPLSVAGWGRVVARSRARGVTVTYWPGWENRGRPGAFAPAGIASHHTGSSADIPAYCFTGGRPPGLPAPLCQLYAKRDGTIIIGARGRANHFGKIAVNADNALRRGLRGVGQIRPGPDARDGNARMYGIEATGSGRFTDRQYWAQMIFFAEVCREHGWGPDVLGHKEGTRRKIDPVHDMGQMRRDVDHAIKNPTYTLTNYTKGTKPTTGGATKAPAPTPTPAKDWFDMATKKDLQEVVRAELRDKNTLQRISDAILGRKFSDYYTTGGKRLASTVSDTTYTTSADLKAVQLEQARQAAQLDRIEKALTQGGAR